MAEAVVDGTPMSHFFCHKCNIEIERLLPDHTCPRCACGFIEELEGGNNSGSRMDIGGEDLSDIEFDNAGFNRPQVYRMDRDFAGVILSIPNALRPAFARNNSLRHSDRRRDTLLSNLQNTRRPNSSHGGQEMVHSLEDVIEDIFNLPGVGLSIPVTQDQQLPVLFLGNPGDYVWGRDGLDAIVTQLLNQMDGTGPPPLPKKQIDEIPTAAVSQSHVDSKLQCSVCWEDFKLDEPVKQLPCQHLYHAPCIIPWLEQHGTCPICRQSLGDQSSAEANQDTVGPSLAALFRAANESNTSRRSSSTSSSSMSEI